jgi:predicted kinase
MKILIIIGLPGSGKTNLVNNITNNITDNITDNITNNITDYIIFDDFISLFYTGEIIKSIKSGKNICLIDPRLCMYEIFKKYIEIIQKYDTDIFLILFENNPSQCLKNVNKRCDSKKDIDRTIIKYSQCYLLDNYNNYNSIILPVWSTIDISNHPL